MVSFLSYRTSDMRVALALATVGNATSGPDPFFGKQYGMTCFWAPDWAWSGNSVQSPEGFYLQDEATPTASWVPILEPGDLAPPADAADPTYMARQREVARRAVYHMTGTYVPLDAPQQLSALALQALLSMCTPTAFARFADLAAGSYRVVPGVQRSLTLEIEMGSPWSLSPAYVAFAGSLFPTGILAPDRPWAQYTQAAGAASFNCERVAIGDYGSTHDYVYFIGSPMAWPTPEPPLSPP